MASIFERMRDMKAKHEAWEPMRNEITSEAEKAFYEYSRAASDMGGLLIEFVQSAIADWEDCQNCRGLTPGELCRGHARIGLLIKFWMAEK